VSVFLVLIFLDSKWADKRLWADMRQAMSEFHLLLISLHRGFKGSYLRLPISNFRFVEVKLHSDTITAGTPFLKNKYRDIQ
jgi:hypothetical protein